VQRRSFINSFGKQVSSRQQRYREACKLLEQFEEIKLKLSTMTSVFLEIEAIILEALNHLPEYSLMYDFKQKGYSEAFDHNGINFRVSFKLRNISTTLVHCITLKIDEVFDLTPDDLVVTIKKRIIAQRY
jgi:hypothetical protein